jgi:hypothetical protein
MWIRWRARSFTLLSVIRARLSDAFDAVLDERSPHALFLNVDPLLDELRSDPRFQDLVSGLKFP